MSMEAESRDSQKRCVLLYYKYRKIEDLEFVRESQETLCKKLFLKGRIRLAEEGINGTLCGTKENLKTYTAETTTIFPDVDWKFSSISADQQAFDGLQVKIVSCIVGNSKDVHYSTNETGVHLSPEEFHKKCNDEDAILIDVRNSYEYAIGHFDGAVNPNTRCFSRFSEWIKEARESGMFKNKEKVLMYCTGGIRCEKASIEMKKQLQNEATVYQLKGGIHRYLEEYGAKGSFKGKNFVFDKRIIQPHEPGTEVVGKCCLCHAPYDLVVDTRRCKKCRLLILVCDSCDEERNQQYWCKDHVYLDPSIYKADPRRMQNLIEKIGELENKLESPSLRGRRNRSKRLIVQKNLDEMRNVQKITMANEKLVAT
mmetsp:Transcript_13911/g.16873  ORF Transcript_13911/g.16873 Transcript_13911/m.16873 type:complete len:369 (-) Transcript_13911:1072-2178(-)